MPQAPAATGTPGAFVSYVHEPHKPSAVRITEELRLRGFTTFRDLDAIRHGHRIEREITDGLAAADVVVFDLTAEALESDPVVEMELKPTIRRFREEGRPVPLIVARGLGATPASVQQATWSRLAIPFDATWTMTVPNADVPIAAADAAHAASRALTTVFAPGRGPSDGAWNLHLATRGHPSHGRELVIDATSLVGGEANRPGTRQDWDRVLAGLRDVERALRAHGGRRLIDVTASAHLTAAFAAGFTFRRVCGWTVCAHTQNGSECHQSESLTHDGLMVISDPGSLNSKVMTVEIDLLGHGIDDAVERALRAGEPPRERLSIHRDAQGQRIDDAELGAMAAAIADQMKRRQRATGVHTVRLFMAAPAPFAVLLGTELNALGTDIELHEFHAGAYHPSLTIDAR